MRSVRLSRGLFVCLALVGLPAPASAQTEPAPPVVAASREPNWAEKMFAEQSHDFGVVARGADVRHRIAVTNIYQETVRITNVSTTCGCSAAQPSQKELKSLETAYIEIRMDTNKFMRRKDSNVDVSMTFDGGASKTVRIPITAYIRSDVVLTPGKAEFGSVDAGAGSQKRIQIAYAGRDNWQIKEVKTGGGTVTAEVRETSRGGGRVNYEMLVTLPPEAPLGAVRDELTLVTDDENNPYVPVLVEGEVVADIIINPTTLPLGQLTPGVDKTMSVVVRGRKPFTIEKIECDSDRECFKVRLPKDLRSVHVLPLTVTPPDQPGQFVEQFTVTVAGRSEPLTFKAEGTIVASGT
jgi:hypothetical protein